MVESAMSRSKTSQTMDRCVQVATLPASGVRVFVYNGRLNAHP